MLDEIKPIEKKAIDPELHDDNTEEEIACPDCGAKLRHAEGCMMCPFCGWSKCG